MRDYYSFKTKEILGKRSVKKGDVILTSVPFVYIIDGQFRGQYCDHCIASSRNRSLKSCKQCCFVFYCSEACEIAGKEIHQHECKNIKKLEPFIPPDFARLLARLIYRLQNGGDTYVEFYAEKKPRKFKDLMNHYRDIRSDENRMNDIEGLYKILKDMIEPENLPSVDDFIGFYGRVLVNRFCLMDSLMCPIGSVVYLAASIFDHSCIPNAYATFIGTKIEVRSLVDLPSLDFNKVFISYIDMMKTTDQRQEELEVNWYFRCNCHLCLNKERKIFENCIKCVSPNCGAPIPVPENWESGLKSNSARGFACLVCNCPVEEDFMKEYQSAVAFTKQTLKGLREESPEVETCLAILERQGNLFSPVNVWRVRALDFAFNGAYCNGIYGLAIDYGRKNAEGMRFFYGSEHPTFGLFLMKLGKSLLYLKELREGLMILEEAEKILAIAIGEKHPLVADEIRRLKMIANEDVNIYMERRILEKDQAEHELVCKHCGRRKNAQAKKSADEGNVQINGFQRKENKNDVYASIANLKRLTDTLSKGPVITPREEIPEKNGDIFASMSQGPNGNVFSAVLSKINKGQVSPAPPPVKRDESPVFSKRENRPSPVISLQNGDSRDPVHEPRAPKCERKWNSAENNKNISRNKITNDNSSWRRSKEDGEINSKAKLDRISSRFDSKVEERNKNSENNNVETNSSEPKTNGNKAATILTNGSSHPEKPGDLNSVIMPSSLSRLLRYGDKLGIASKSKSNRDSIYSILGSSSASNLDKNEKHKPIEPTPLRREALPPVTTDKRIVEEVAQKIEPKETKEQEPATIKADIKKAERIDTKADIKKAERIDTKADPPLEKIGRLYTKEVEQKWGLDYVPEKPPSKTANKYKLAETNKIWERFISDADVRWAKYIAEIEFNIMIAQLEDDSESEDEDIVNGVEEVV